MLKLLTELSKKAYSNLPAFPYAIKAKYLYLINYIANKIMPNYLKTFFLKVYENISGKKVDEKSGNKKVYYTLPFTLANFDFKSLCPAMVSTPEERIQWLNSYLDHLPENSVLLFGDDKDDKNELNLFFKNPTTRDKHHITLPAFNVHPENKLITLNMVTATLTDRPLQSALKNIHANLPKPYHLPSENELNKLKFSVHISRKAITQDLWGSVKQETDRTIENLEQCEQCVICLEKYSNENPPVLANSGFVFHEACFNAHLKSQYDHGLQDLTCPQSGTVLFSYEPGLRLPFNPKPFSYRDTSYNAMLGNIDELMDNTKKLEEMLKVLLEENRYLKAKMAAPSPSDNNSPPEASDVVVRIRP